MKPGFQITRGQAKAVFELTEGPVNARIHIRRAYRAHHSTHHIDVVIGNRVARLDRYGRPTPIEFPINDYRRLNDERPAQTGPSNAPVPAT